MSLPQNVITVTTVHCIQFTVPTVLPWNFPHRCGIAIITVVTAVLPLSSLPCHPLPRNRCPRECDVTHCRGQRWRRTKAWIRWCQCRTSSSPGSGSSTTSCIGWYRAVLAPRWNSPGVWLPLSRTTSSGSVPKRTSPPTCTTLSTRWTTHWWTSSGGFSGGGGASRLRQPLWATDWRRHSRYS